MGNGARELVNIRRMTVADIPAVLIVEQDVFTMPWTEHAFVNELVKNPFAHYFVLELDARIVGYGGVWLVMQEAHITNFAIHSSVQRHGYGEQLFQEVLETAKQYDTRKMTLEVRTSNTAAQRLYEKFGFVKTGIEKGYYTDTKEDAFVMTLEMEPS